MHMIIEVPVAGCYECNNVSSSGGTSYVYCTEYSGGGGRGGRETSPSCVNKVFKEILLCNYFVKTGLYAIVVSISMKAVTECANGFCAINLPFSGKL